MSYSMSDLLQLVVSEGASDLHIRVGTAPVIRVHGILHRVEGPSLSPEDSEELMRSITSEDHIQHVRERGGADFGFAFGDMARFRVSVFKEKGNFGLVLRQIPNKMLTMEQIGLPPSAKELLYKPRGLVLVTGPTGSGKTTTLAAMCRHINETRPVHVITIEDPIEYVHRDGRAIIVQRQVGVHVESFQRALRAALREDPDVIVVGEMRDLETMQLAITAAETGHLVMATLHTVSASQTISRIVSSFPSGQQWQVRAMMADSLRAVISQQLLPKMNGAGRVPAVELLLNSEAVANLIREDKLFQIPGVVESSASKGMRLMDQDLIRLVSEGLVEPTEALDRAHDKLDFSTRVEFRKKV